MKTIWIKGEIIGKRSPDGKIIISDETGGWYIADRLCRRERDENDDMWYEVEVGE